LRKVRQAAERLAALSGSFGEILLKLALFTIALFGFGKGVFFADNHRPELRILAVEFHPLFGACVRIWADGIGRAFRLADAAIDAFIGVDHQHVLALVEAIYWADFDAVCVFASDARVVDDVGHMGDPLIDGFPC